MEPAIIVIFVIMVGLLILSVPIGIAIGLAVLVGVAVSDFPMVFFSQRFFNNFDSFPLMAIPFFILAGEIMQHGTLSKNLLGLCSTAVGHRRGGLAQISVLTCLFYGALCGSAAATTAAVGGIMIPAMEKEGYPKAFSTAVNSASGSLGVMIPPSIALILYGAFGSVSVSDLFIATIVPGIMVGIAFMVTNAIITSRHNYGVMSPKATWRERLVALKKAGFALGVPVIILGGIYGGITTPTEAGVVAVAYAFFIDGVITRTLTKERFKIIMLNTLKTLGMLFMVIITANALGAVLLFYNVQDLLLSEMRNITENPHVFLLIMLGMFLILGTFVEATAIILIMTPLLVPLASSYGIHGVQFGIFMLISLCVGFLTPPVGTNLFVGCSISGVDIISLTKAIWPFILAMLVVILMVAFIPFLSLMLI
ncbi:TRAP transporter large permease [Desulfovibrio sp. OttesenSCG-928-C14]|nr:TRAP transporter large permease [Desulfovibrio sp. OttesenSCG-928-C14]